MCQPQNPPASSVLAPDIKSSPDDNSLGGGVRSPAILWGEKLGQIDNVLTGEKLEKYLYLAETRNTKGRTEKCVAKVC